MIDKQTRSRLLNATALMTAAIVMSACSEDTPPETLSVSTDVLAVLADFEADGSSLDMQLDGAQAERTSAGALKIAFSPDADYSKVVLKPETPWDWSRYKDYHIAFDAKNLSDASVQLHLGIVDNDGDTSRRTGAANRATNLAKGETGTYYAALDGIVTPDETGLRENPPAWTSDAEMMNWRWGKKEINTAAIQELQFFVRGTLAPKSVEIDNIRLVKNPENDTQHLEAIVDQFGQNAKQAYPVKIEDLEALKTAANEERAALDAGGLMADRSRFGGWKDGPRQEATGFFRAEKVNGKWWLIDPEGYLFFSHGPGNVRMANLTTLTGVDFTDDAIRTVDPDEVTPEDSIGIVTVPEDVRATRYVSNPLRHNMFNWLPDYDDPLADHYSYRRSVHKGPMTSGETFSFYRANLERRYGESTPGSYVKDWEDVTLSRMNNWGFTSFGNWVDPAFYPNQKVPYFANGWIIGDFETLSSGNDVWAPMPDFFDPEFERRADVTISVIAQEIEGSPWCVGVFVDNEKSWGFRDGTLAQRYGIVQDALLRSADASPAKAAFTELMKARYPDIAALNAAWGADFKDWQAFAAGHDAAYSGEGYGADLSAMLAALSEQYFKAVHDTLERYLPNHLYMGARMANWGMPDETIAAATKYSDVMSFNVYEEGLQPNQWAFLKDIDLPTVIGEFHIGATNGTGLFHPGLVQADDQSDRAQMYLDYMESLLALDNFVGAHWFQYVDSPITGRAFDGENYNVGFVSVTDIPYPEMIDAAKSFNAKLYPTRYGDPVPAGR